jgi:SAM-dependent methyltransferase
MTTDAAESTRRSWDVATRNHNAHKGDQAAWLRGGGDTLFPEELALLGELEGKALVHLQCNAGQDTLCLARRGATVTGVDFSGEAVAFAERLTRATGLAAHFVLSEVCTWMETTEARFDVAFCSYGVVGWQPDLQRWARGVARVLRPGGRFVYVDFHPVCWSVGEGARLTGDDYFQEAPFVSPVGDYVKDSGAGLGAVQVGETEDNTVPATSFQYGLGQVVQAIMAAGLQLEVLREYPHANGCKVVPCLVPAEGRRWVWPGGTARVPLMFGLSARRP